MKSYTPRKTTESFCTESQPLSKLLPPGNPKCKNKGLRFPGVRKLGVLESWYCAADHATVDSGEERQKNIGQGKGESKVLL